MIFLALVLLGLIAAEKVAVSPLPDVDIPEITVRVSRPNVGIKELENTVVKPLKNSLLQVPDLQNFHSVTSDGNATIYLRFKYGTTIDYAFLEVNEKIDMAMNNLPRDMYRPQAVKSSVSDLPVFYLNLSYKDKRETHGDKSFIALSNLARQVIKRRLEQLPQVALADITGTEKAQLVIVPDEAALTALQLSDNDFRNIILSHNLNTGNVKARDGELEYHIRFSDPTPLSAEDIKEISFEHKGRVFKLKDVAQVKVEEEDTEGVYIANGQKAVNLAIIKQPEARMDDLRREISSLIENFRKDYPQVQFEQTRDQTELLEFSISNLKQDLYTGGLLAFLLMFFFLRNIRSPLLIGITIPVSLLISLLFFKLLHISINIISLSGLVLGVGLMIDNSIIVIDNITQFRDRNVSLDNACVKGTEEIIRPLISSVLTTCSVFLPLIFLSGIAGALFYDQAMAITIGLSVSLIISVTLLPVLYRMFHIKKTNALENKFFDRYGIHFFERWYESGFHWVFRYKIAALAIVTGLIVSSLLLFRTLKKEQLPVFQQMEIVVQIDWNQNIYLDESERRLREMMKLIKGEVLLSEIKIGPQQYLMDREQKINPSQAHIYLKAKNTAALTFLQIKINNWVTQNYPNASLDMHSPENLFEKVFGSEEPPLLIKLKPSEAHLYTPGPAVDSLIRDINQHFPESPISALPKQETVVISADPDRLMVYDISLDAINNRIKQGFGSSEIGTIGNGEQAIPIKLRQSGVNINDMLQQLTVANSKGVKIPIADFLQVTKEQVYQKVESDEEGEYISLKMQATQPQRVIDYLTENFKDSWQHIRFGGSYFSNQKMVKEMGLVLMVSILLLYFILAAQFESLLQPLIVLFELPISISGALFMLFIFDSSLNLISLIGLVVMCGIVINDSILKIDTINELKRHKGYTLIDAIHTAGVRRLKSIIMTSLTTILSVLPFLWGNDMGSVLQRPLSLTLIGSMIIGTPVSLYFIPLVYWFCYRKEDEKIQIKNKIDNRSVPSQHTEP